MTSQQFLSGIAKKVEPAYLFVGPEHYMRTECRRALLDRVLPGEEARENGFTRHDLGETELAAVIDDARSMSLFASERVIWASSAEQALPREVTKDNAPQELADWLAEPAPGVVIVFDSSRYDFEGEDKTRIQRVQKYFGAVKAQVEFPRLDAFAARKLAADLAKKAGLNIASAELELLVDVLASDAVRIATEIEKLATYAEGSRRITAEDIWAMVPNARATTIFALVGAIARGDRAASLEALDILTREGEYLALALTFLGAQFRMALAAKEAGLANAGQIQAAFAKQGMQIWPSRAQQVAQTAGAFPVEKLRAALAAIYETDKALRDTRPDDRTVMERFVLKLT